MGNFLTSFVELVKITERGDTFMAKSSSA